MYKGRLIIEFKTRDIDAAQRLAFLLTNDDLTANSAQLIAILRDTQVVTSTAKKVE